MNAEAFFFVLMYVKLDKSTKQLNPDNHFSFNLFLIFLFYFNPFRLA